MPTDVILLAISTNFTKVCSAEQDWFLGKCPEA